MGSGSRGPGLSTLGPEGVPGPAPHGFFAVASLNPPMRCASASAGAPAASRPPKDTPRNNVEETGELVVNVVPLPLSNAMDECSKGPTRG